MIWLLQCCHSYSSELQTEVISMLHKTTPGIIHYYSIFFFLKSKNRLPWIFKSCHIDSTESLLLQKYIAKGVKVNPH